MLRFATLRLIIAVLPIVAWFVWVAVARRQGRPVGATPWAWLVAAGLALAAASLLVTGAMQPDNRDQAYVPKEAGPE